jgi:peptide/nickel transport system permease protein
MITAMEKENLAKERYFVASQWQLMWRKFRRHRLAIIGGVMLALLYLVGVVFCEFFSTQDIYQRNKDYIFCSPQAIHFRDRDGRFHLRPFVYGLKAQKDPETLATRYLEDPQRVFPLKFFARGYPYKLWGLVPMDHHLVTVPAEGTLFLLGTDKLGRDLYSRILFGARVSLTIGLVGVMLSFILGCILGGISGYYGGAVDVIIQRVIEFLICLPTIPLWMALAAAVPPDWSPLKVYFSITIILSLVGWCGLARVVRGKLISAREEDYVMAARIAGASDRRIIFKHLLPSFIGYLIVSLTLAIPGMILGETALSFLGLGVRAPIVSWGVLLNDAQTVKVVIMHPWLLSPAVFVILTVLGFNFVGDGLRDAADPYK